MFYPTKTQKITENVYAIRNVFVNFFVYTDSVNYICIDAGISGFLAKMGLSKLCINPEDISHVFLTHTDYDHVGGLGLFNNAKVYISEEEEQMINGTTSRALKVKYNSLKRTYNLLEDNEEVSIGKIKVKAISTPGHTPGSMSYIINDDILFSGDTLTLRRGMIYPFYWLQNMNTRRQEETIKNLAEKYTNFNWLFTAHTGYSNDYQHSIQRWI